MGPRHGSVPGTIDSLAEHGRHRLVLHDRPHQLEVLPAGQLVSSADLFVRTHPKVGPHHLLLWCSAELLASQFAHPNALRSTSGYVVGLLATGTDEDLNPVVRLAMFEGVTSPGPVARALTIRLLCMTTSHTLLNTFDDAEFAVDETLYVLVDTDLVSQLMLTFERGSPVRWRT
jgi:hypothetical protein